MPQIRFAAADFRGFMARTGCLYRDLRIQAVALLGLLMVATRCAFDSPRVCSTAPCPMGLRNTFEAARERISHPSESGYEMRRTKAADE